MSIRDRLTLIYAAIFTLAFLSFTLAVYSLPRTTLAREIDRDLRETVQGMLEETQVYNRRDLQPLVVSRNEDLGVFARASIFMMAVDPEGNVITRSDNLAGFDGILDESALREREEQFTTREYNGQPIRVMTVPLSVQRGTQEELIGHLQVGRLIEDYDSFNRLLVVSIFLGLAAMTASVFVVTLLAPRLFQPLEEIATVARQITRADDLSRRVPDAGRADEIGDLTMAFNQTLARLENLFRTQQRFLADVSHELRTPLTTIRGNVDLMRRMGEAEPELLNDIQAELERMTRLVNDLLLLARADVGSLPIERRPVDLDALLLDVFRQISLLDRPVDVVLREIDQVQVSGDADRLKQLMLNLVDNAVKYTPAGGKVFLALSKTDDLAHLEIADTGVGIPEEDLPHIFDRFYRVDKARTRAHGGSGLGLSIAYWIVQAHGGAIDVTSEVGEGTTFHITLPLRASSQNGSGADDVATTYPYPSLTAMRE